MLMGAVALVLMGFLAVKLRVDARPKPGSDNCIGTVTANTVILLDHSEKVAAQTLNEIVARAMAYVLEKAALNERVSVFTITDLSKRNLEPLVSLCRPERDG